MTIYATSPGRARAYCNQCDTGIASKRHKVWSWVIAHSYEHQGWWN